MTQRVILTYKQEDGLGEAVRLFLKDGVTQNPDVEETIKARELTAVSIRRTGEKKRSLLFVEETQP